MFSFWLKHLRLLLLWGLIVAIFSAGVSLLFPIYYRAESEVLIIVPPRGSDPYTQAKSAERLGEHLSQLVGTADFFSKVMTEGSGFDKERWQAATPRQQRRRWKRDVTASSRYNSSLVRLTVYSRTPEDTLGLNQAVTETFTRRAPEYVGGDMTARAVNPPLLSLLPGRPNFLGNSAAGLVAGILLSALWLSRYRRGGLFGRE